MDKNSDTMVEMVYIEPGKFRTAFEGPVDKVKEAVKSFVFQKAFFIGRFPVTQGIWEAVTGNNPSQCNKGDDYPVEHVSWLDINEKFLPAINAVNPTRGTFRLPTEAEWEYACRAGVSDDVYYWGNTVNGDYCWYSSNSEGKTHPVGQKKPNAWGLYDMTGNVWEWCSDTYVYFSGSPGNCNPEPTSGTRHILRGGAWFSYGNILQSSFRTHMDPAGNNSGIGFRLVFDMRS